MLSCLATALLLSALTSDPLDVPAHSASGEIVDVGIHATATDFHARNYSASPQVFLFRLSGTTLVVYYTLPAGMDMRFTFAEHSLDGMEMEIVSKQSGLLFRTGSIALDDVSETESQLLWIQKASSSSRTWEQVGTGVALIQPGDTMLPGSLQNCIEQGGAIPPDLNAVHVPVITPGGHPPGDLPPDIEDTPLPPV